MNDRRRFDRFRKGLAGTRVGVLGIGLLACTGWMLAGVVRGASEPSPADRAERLLREAIEQTLRGEALTEAEGKLNEALAVFRDLGDLRGEAESERALGALLADRQTYAQAREHLRRSAALWLRQGELFGAWFSYYTLGEASRFSGFCRDALESFDEADRLLTLIADDPLEPIDFGVLAQTRDALGFAAFGELPPPILQALRPILIDSLRAMAILGRATCMNDLGRYDDALAVLDDAASAPQLAGIMEAKLLHARAEIHHLHGAMEKAEIAYDEARHRARRAIRDAEQELASLGIPIEMPPVAQADELLALRGLAAVQQEMGKMDDARATIQRALALDRAVGIPTIRAQLLRQLAMLLLDRGQPAAAGARLDQALALARSQGDRAGEARLLRFLGLMETMMGNERQALAWTLEAREVLQAMGHRLEEARTLLVMGRLEVALHRLPMAYRYFQDSMRMAAELGVPDLEIEAMLGVAGAQEQAAPGSGLALVNQALDLARQHERPGQQSSALVLLGDVQMASGNLSAARDAYAEAHRMASRLDIPVIMGAADRGLGLMYHRSGRPVDAMAAMARAESVLRGAGFLSQAEAARTMIGTLYRQMGDDDAAIEVWRDVADRLDERLQALPSAELAASFSSLLPDALHDALVDLHAARGDVAAAFGYAERARARSLLQRLGSPWEVRGLDDDSSLVSRVRDHAQRLTLTERQLAQDRRQHLDLPSRRRQQLLIDLDTQREALRQARIELAVRQPESAALVSVDVVDLEAVGDEILGPAQTLVSYFVLERRVVAWVIDRSGHEMIALDIGRAALRDHVQQLERDVADRHSRPPALAALYEALVAPLNPYIRHRELIVVPHGVLHRVPFAALWHEAQQRFLIEESILSYAPSVSSLRFLADKGSRGLGRALVLGDPDGSLPHAREEARVVGDIHHTPVLLGAEASEAQVRRAVRSGIDFMHVAAHAVWDGERPHHSRLALAPGDGEDGALEVHEVLSELDLRGVGLVVLSACSTAGVEALSRAAGGGDLAGLARALMAAGSPAVVATSWRIDDRASRALMASFHRHLRAGFGVAHALREGQLATLRQADWRAPYFWAAFAVYGNGEEALHPVQDSPRNQDSPPHGD